MDKEKKSKVITTLLIILFVALVYLSAGLGYKVIQENGKTIRKESYMASVMIEYAVDRAYYMHVNYTHFAGHPSTEDLINMTRDRQEVITMLNFSISTLKDASGRCDIVGLTHKGLDKNIVAYEKLRDFLLENWGNTSEVLPVTGYIKNEMDEDNYEVLFPRAEDAECCFDYNYDFSEEIYAGLAQAPR